MITNGVIILVFGLTLRSRHEVNTLNYDSGHDESITCVCTCILFYYLKTPSTLLNTH
jgi:hypothetical protein